MVGSGSLREAISGKPDSPTFDKPSFLLLGGRLVQERGCFLSTFVPPESAVFPACIQHCCYSVRRRHVDIDTHQHKHTNTQRHKPTHAHPNPQALEHTNTSTRAHGGATRGSGSGRGLFVGKTGRTLDFSWTVHKHTSAQEHSSHDTPHMTRNESGQKG